VADLRELQRKLGSSRSVRVDSGPGSLSRLSVNSDLANAEIYLHGAHIAHFQPRGAAPVLFMSKESFFEAGKPIRGGVPVIFPWFGARAGHPESAAHGFARLREWQFESSEVLANGSTRIVLALSDDQETKRQWPFAFAARLVVVVATVLEITLEIRNPSMETIQFEEALHTYLSVGDVRQARVEGLDGITYVDKVDGGIRKTQEAGGIMPAGETDRLYLHTRSTTVVRDPGLGRSITIEKEGSDATVVWNPWTKKAQALPDFGDEEWPRMLCVETVNAADCAVRLAPGCTHEMKARIAISGM
jgi:glucose-6-phosphate 1-epimerase